MESQETERPRFARDLNDGVGQVPAAAGINHERLRDMIDRRNPGDDDTAGFKIPLARSIGILGNEGQHVRAISHALGTSTLWELRLVAASGELLGNMEAQATTSH